MTDAPASGLSRAEQLSASPRIFDNPILDKLSRVHWAFPLLYLPVAAWFFWRGLDGVSLGLSLGLAVFGYFAWTICEYVFHRWLFHTEFPGKFGERIHFLLHGVHHIYPNDPLRLVMPPLMSVPLMALAYVVTFAIFGAPYGYPIAAGFLVGYVIYDEIHFHIHHRKPRTKVEMTLRRLHLLHHFRDPERGYGVSAPYWDYAFGTAYAKDDKPGEKAL
ncbi:MAG: sterol desaturase family protein [Hyphomicrobiales bacterium]|nr:sterol desaturase family protein [Hyphomicrobiales bacterium]